MQKQNTAKGNYPNWARTRGYRKGLKSHQLHKLLSVQQIYCHHTTTAIEKYQEANSCINYNLTQYTTRRITPGTISKKKSMSRFDIQYTVGLNPMISSMWLCNQISKGNKEGDCYRDLLFLSVNNGDIKTYDMDKVPTISTSISTG